MVGWVSCGFLMCGCEYFCFLICVCGFCNVGVSVRVDFLMCVYVWIMCCVCVCVGFVIC